VNPLAHRLVPALAALALVVAGCANSSASTTPSASSAASAAASSGTAGSALTVGLGYIPSVQFAQFYYAQQRGLYKAAGLDVTLQNEIDSDLLVKVGQGSIAIGIGDGTSIIPAVSQGIPVVYTATMYGTFPDIVIAKAGAGITKPADLKGKKIGIPGKYGSSWIMLQALLKSASLTTDDVQIVTFPKFTQAAALQQGQVDAATGFTNNEPIQLKNAGFETVSLTVDSIVPLPGPGLVTGTATLKSKTDALKAFTKATLQAMTDIAADPQKGLDATFALVPELATDKPLQAQILAATIATWKNARTPAAPYGAIDTAGWQQSLDFMTGLGLVPNVVQASGLTDASLLP